MSQLKLLNLLINTIRTKHYSIRTEQAYVKWVKNFILYYHKKYPTLMDEKEINDYLAFLAVKRNVSASTQNQALCAILFRYKEVLYKEIGLIDTVTRAKRTHKLPVVFTCDEFRKVLLQLEGTKWLMASLLYGPGLRLMEYVRLRIKDIDFSYQQICVRDGKGYKDVRMTMIYTHVLNKGGLGVKSPLD
jgi:site-specific recombinase XerD